MGAGNVPAFYNLASFSFKPSAQIGFVDASWITTIGSYTRANCGSLCAPGYGFFVVQAVPEPSAFGLMSAGLASVAWIVRRRRGRNSAA